MDRPIHRWSAGGFKVVGRPVQAQLACQDRQVRFPWFRVLLAAVLLLTLAALTACGTGQGTPPAVGDPGPDGPGIVINIAGATGGREPDLLRLDPAAGPFTITITAPGLQAEQLTYIKPNGLRTNLSLDATGSSRWTASLPGLTVADDDYAAGWLLVTGERAGQKVDHAIVLAAGAVLDEIETPARTLSAALFDGRQEVAAAMLAPDTLAWIPAVGSTFPAGNFALMDTSSGWPLLLWQQSGSRFERDEETVQVVRSLIDEDRARATVQLAYRVTAIGADDEAALWLMDERIELQAETGRWQVTELFRTGVPLAADGTPGWNPVWLEAEAGSIGTAVAGAQRIGPFSSISWGEDGFWDPPGRRLIFMAENFGQTEVWQAEPRAQEARRLYTIDRNRIPWGRDTYVQLLGWYGNGSRAEPLIMISFLQTDDARLGIEGIRILALGSSGPRELLWLPTAELGRLDWFHQVYPTKDEDTRLLVNDGAVYRLQLKDGQAEVLLADLPNHYMTPVRIGPAGRLLSFIAPSENDGPLIGVADLTTGGQARVAAAPGQWIGRGGFTPDGRHLVVRHAWPDELALGDTAEPGALIGIELVDGEGRTTAWLDAHGVTGGDRGAIADATPSWQGGGSVGPWRLHRSLLWAPDGKSLAVIVGTGKGDDSTGDVFTASRLLLWDPAAGTVKEMTQFDRVPAAFVEWLTDPMDAASALIATWGEYDHEEGRWHGVGFDPASGEQRPVSRPDGFSRTWVGSTTDSMVLVLPGVEPGTGDGLQGYPGLLVERVRTGSPFARLEEKAMRRQAGDRVLLSTPYYLDPISLENGYAAIVEDTSNRSFYPWRSYFWLIPGPD